MVETRRGDLGFFFSFSLLLSSITHTLQRVISDLHRGIKRTSLLKKRLLSCALRRGEIKGFDLYSKLNVYEIYSAALDPSARWKMTLSVSGVLQPNRAFPLFHSSSCSFSLRYDPHEIFCRSNLSKMLS